ncbi:hypothetical protein OAO87_03290 [bacterium]|nr:hypothetical protein [bacterium]
MRAAAKSARPAARYRSLPMVARAVPRSDDPISDCISRAQAAAFGTLSGGIVGSVPQPGLAPQVSARRREARAFARSAQIHPCRCRAAVR